MGVWGTYWLSRLSKEGIPALAEGSEGQMLETKAMARGKHPEAKLRVRALWAVLLLGAATMLATSPPGWHLEAEEQVDVGSLGMGDDVALRVKVETPPSLTAPESGFSSGLLELIITTDRRATDVLVVFERAGSDGGTMSEAHFSDDEREGKYLYENFDIMRRGTCPEDAPCVDETTVLLTTEEATPIGYQVRAKASLFGQGDNAPPGEISLTLEELDAGP